MNRFVPFHPSHLEAFSPDPAMPVAMEEIRAADIAALANGYAWTMFRDGAAVACGGLLPVWAGRAVAWSLLSPAMGPHAFLAADRQVRRVLAQARADGFRRIEATVDPRHPGGRGLRWALSLGFAPEGLMKHWTRDGRHMWLVAITGEIE